MKMKKTTVTASDGIGLNVVSCGDKKNVPIVLVHGYPDNHRVWMPVIEQLAKQYFVVAYDVRGAGASDAPAATSSYKLDQLSRDLASVADALLQGRRFHLAAHDWGSIQSWESVATPRLQGRIASYTTISGPSLDHVGSWMQRLLFSLSPADKLLFARQALTSFYIGMLHLPLVPQGWDVGLARLWPKFLLLREGVVEAVPNPTQAADGKHGARLYRANCRSRLFFPQERHAHCPVQLIVPTLDHYAGTYMYEDLPQWAPELYRREIAAKHWVQLSHPEKVAAWIAEFVDGIEAGVMPAALQQARVDGLRHESSRPGVQATGPAVFIQ